MFTTLSYEYLAVFEILLFFNMITVQVHPPRSGNKYKKGSENF